MQRVLVAIYILPFMVLLVGLLALGKIFERIGQS